MKKCLLIVNMRAGKRRIKNSLANIIELLGKFDYRCIVEITQYPKHAKKIAMEEKEADLIVVAGGDGTLNEVINGIMRREKSIPLGYIPCGTTNDFASSIGISKNSLKATYNIVRGSELLIDIGRMEDDFFCYIASFGAFTESVYHTNQSIKNTIGYVAYLLEGIKSLSDIKPIKLKVFVNDNYYEEEYIFGAISNTTCIAGFLKMDNKMVKMNDGVFELFLIRYPKDMAEIAKIIAYITDKNYNNEYIKLIQTTKVIINCDELLNWNFDGEKVLGKKEMVFSLEPKAIKLIKNSIMKG